MKDEHEIEQDEGGREKAVVPSPEITPAIETPKNSRILGNQEQNRTQDKEVPALVEEIFSRRRSSESPEEFGEVAGGKKHDGERSRSTHMEESDIEIIAVGTLGSVCFRIEKQDHEKEKNLRPNPCSSAEAVRASFGEDQSQHSQDEGREEKRFKEVEHGQMP
jgi:hypothetical protein